MGASESSEVILAPGRAFWLMQIKAQNELALMLACQTAKGGYNHG